MIFSYTYHITNSFRQSNFASLVTSKLASLRATVQVKPGGRTEEPRS